MHRRLEVSKKDKRRGVKTSVPGIYKREGVRTAKPYYCVFRVNGVQKKEYAATLKEARKLKEARRVAVDSGEFFAASKVTLYDYGAEWVENYKGGGRGFKESTRSDYRSDLKRYIVPFFTTQAKLAHIQPKDVRAFVDWLCDGEQQQAHQNGLLRAENKQRQIRDKEPKPLLTAPVELSDATVRRIVSPLRSLLRCAVDDGLIRYNPARETKLPYRPATDDNDEEEKRPLTRTQLAKLLGDVASDHRLMFRFLASTGLRIGECIALQWRHLELDTTNPKVKVRRRLYKDGISTPKSRYGKRDVPLSRTLASDLRKLRMSTDTDLDAPVFPNGAGNPRNPANIRTRVLRPVVDDTDLDWVNLHTFRHTFASILFARGANVAEVSRLLGHHSAAYTLRAYVHLLPDETPAALDLDVELSGVTSGATDSNQPHPNQATTNRAKLASIRGTASPN